MYRTSLNILKKTFLFSLSMILIFVGSAWSKEKLTYERLVQIIEENNVKNIEELLPLLPKEYRSSYTLMFRSQSLQSAAPNSPRVIMFGNDASLILGYNGDSKLHKGKAEENPFYKLEVIQFRKDKAAFEFHEISFPTPSNQKAKVHFSQTNPKKCLRCHRQDPRPNWKHYNRWPGAYGGHGDFSDASEIEPGERENLEQFLKNKKKDPRYRILVGLEKGYKIDGIRGTAAQHNNEFTSRVAQHNFQRVVRLMRATPHYSHYKYAIMAAVLCKVRGANFVSSYIPSTIRGWHDGNKPIKSSRSQPKDPTPYIYVAEDELRYIFERRGYPIDDWFMNFKSNTFNRFATPGVPGSELGAALMESDPDLLNIFGLRKNHRLGSRELVRFLLANKKDGCKKLKERSYKELSKLSKKPIQKEPCTQKYAECEDPQSQPQKTLAQALQVAKELANQKSNFPLALGRCMECHTGSDPIGPSIPFDDPEKLKKVLVKRDRAGKTLIQKILYSISQEVTKVGEGMPPDKPLSEAERMSLIEYLTGLQK